MGDPTILASHGELARPWSRALERANVPLAAVFDLASGDLDAFAALLSAHPESRVAVWCAGPLEAASIAPLLIDRDAPCLLHPAPVAAVQGDGPQLSHGWLSLSGVEAVSRLLDGPDVEEVRLSARGRPEGRADGLQDALYHAATLVGRFGDQVEIESAVLRSDSSLEARLAVGGRPWRLDVDARGHGITLVVRTRGGDFQWGADETSESLRPPRGEARVIPSSAWSERTLSQLVKPLIGADMNGGRAAHGLVSAITRHLERRLPPGRWSPAMPEAGLSGLGLRASLPDTAPLAPTSVPPELWWFETAAYRLGLRPALHLVTTQSRFEQLRHTLPGTVLSRETLSSSHRLHDAGSSAPLVEVFAAQEAALAERLMTLESEAEIAADMGDPACCTQALLARTSARSEDVTRYALAASTPVKTEAWPSVLDDTLLPLCPHLPCSYACERSRTDAAQVLEALAAREPERFEEASRCLGGPVLYFDRVHQLRFDGSVDDPVTVRFDAVSIPAAPSPAFAHFAGAVALGDRLVLTRSALIVHQGGTRLFALERTDPGLGVLLPFSPLAG